MLVGSKKGQWGMEVLWSVVLAEADGTVLAIAVLCLGMASCSRCSGQTSSDVSSEEDRDSIQLLFECGSVTYNCVYIWQQYQVAMSQIHVGCFDVGCLAPCIIVTKISRSFQ